MKPVFIDVDGTLTEVSSPWQDVHEYFGLWKERGVPILDLWLSGKITYDEFCYRDVELWNASGVRLEDVLERFDSYPVRPEAAELLHTLAENGYVPVLLSTGFTHIAERIVAEVQLARQPDALANYLYAADDRLAVEVHVSGDLNSSRSKAGHVRRVCMELGVPAESAVAIGDGPSDQHMFDACGTSYLVTSGSDLLNAAREILST